MTITCQTEFLLDPKDTSSSGSSCSGDEAQTKKFIEGQRELTLDQKLRMDAHKGITNIIRRIYKTSENESVHINVYEHCRVLDKKGLITGEQWQAIFRELDFFVAADAQRRQLNKPLENNEQTIMVKLTELHAEKQNECQAIKESHARETAARKMAEQKTALRQQEAALRWQAEQKIAELERRC